MNKNKFIFILLFTACQPRSHDLPEAKFTNSVCEKTYAKFYAKPVLDFRIIFGYKDARPARYVGDRYEEAYFIQKILGLGFERVKNQDDTFAYSVIAPDGQKKAIRLSIAGSSVGPDDDENRNDPFQKWKSTYAENLFLNGLKTADLVFYYGHSRDGGGPDFNPPKLTKNHHTDYAWYVKHRTGLKKMLAAVKSGQKDARLLGLYSCVSDKLFTKSLQKVNPNISLMTSHVLLYYNDALDGMFEALSAIIKMKCQQDFHPTGTDIIHFFKNS
jgi:hypothetical protein